MATTEEISKALGYLKEWHNGIGKKHSRHHTNVDADDEFRRRALDGGICSRCRHLNLRFNKDHAGKHTVGLQCGKGVSIVALYQFTDLGCSAVCNRFEQK